ncbi:MAG: preprotein translocase subunit SecG [Clostridia bacterium]|nr:preprotein translocase subunit SecG [Clostridia bacterium]
MEIVLGALLIIVAIAIIIIVLLQQSREAGLSGVIAGGAETFLGKNKGRSIEAKLSKWTKILAIIFFVLTLGVVLLLAFTH